MQARRRFGVPGRLFGATVMDFWRYPRAHGKKGWAIHFQCGCQLCVPEDTGFGFAHVYCYGHSSMEPRSISRRDHRWWL